jgi:hypothetical protein
VTRRTGSHGRLMCNWGQRGVTWATSGYRPQGDTKKGRKRCTDRLLNQGQSKWAHVVGATIWHGVCRYRVACSRLVRGVTSCDIFTPNNHAPSLSTTDTPYGPHTQTSNIQPIIWIYTALLRTRAVPRMDYVCLCTNFGQLARFFPHDAHVGTPVPNQAHKVIVMQLLG